MILKRYLLAREGRQIIALYESIAIGAGINIVDLGQTNILVSSVPGLSFGVAKEIEWLWHHAKI